MASISDAHLAHEQPVEERGLVVELQVLGARGEPARQQAVRRGADALVAETVERLVDRRR